MKKSEGKITDTPVHAANEFIAVIQNPITKERIAYGILIVRYTANEIIGIIDTVTVCVNEETDARRRIVRRLITRAKNEHCNRLYVLDNLLTEDERKDLGLREQGKIWRVSAS